MHIGPAGVEQGDVFGVAIGVAQRVGQQQGGDELAVGSQPLRAGHVVAHGFGDALPSGVVLGGGAQAQQTTKVFHAPMGLAVLVHVKTVHHQRLAVVRQFCFGCGHDAAGHLHAQVFVQGHEGQLAA